MQSYIGKLKEKGIITDEEIEKYKFESEQGEKQRNQFVLEGLKMGLSRRAIADLDEDGYLTESMVKLTIKKLKADGTVTDEEIKSWKTDKQKELKKEKNKSKREYDKQIIALLKKGYLEREIAEEFGKALTTISARVSSIKNNGKITEEEIRIAREKRKEREEKTAKQEEKRIVQEENKYEEYMEKARRIVSLETEPSIEKINVFANEFIDILKKRQNKGELKIEELKELDDLMFMTKTDAKVILEVVRLHLSLRDYLGGLYFLKSINSILEGEDKEKIGQIIKNMEVGQKKKEAFEMLSKGDKLEEIHKITGLSMVEILSIKNKYINRNNSNKIPIENEFFGLQN